MINKIKNGVVIILLIGFAYSLIFLFKKNNSINYDFTGKLPYSWPSRLSIDPLNVGAKNYNPLFEYGYGLSYQD